MGRSSRTAEHSLIEALLQRVSTLKARVRELEEENEELRASAAEATPKPEAPTAASTPLESVRGRVLRAAFDVSRDLLKTKDKRSDFRFGNGKKLREEIKRCNVEGVRALLAVHPELPATLRCPAGDQSELSLTGRGNYGVGGATALHLAAAHGAVDVCRLLLDSPGVDPWVTDLSGQTALHVAASMFQSDVCELLLDRMGNPLGPAAPVDLMGITPAGRAALQNPPTGDTEADAVKRERRSHCSLFLHRVGDKAISPLKVKRSRRARGRWRSDGANAEVHPLSVGHCTMPGFRVTNEDATCVAPSVQLPSGAELGVFAVFDGHGGPRAAEFCGAQVAQTIVDVAATASSGNDNVDLGRAAYDAMWALEEKLAAVPAFAVARKELKPAMGDEPAVHAFKADDGSGTTAVMMLLGRDTLSVANVGDSRAVLCSAGVAVPLSRDHAIPRELAVLDEAGAEPVLRRATSSDEVVAGLSSLEDFVARERVRIHKAGGNVTSKGRVQCLLKPGESDKYFVDLEMTRSLGNFLGKTRSDLSREAQAISAEPEVVVRQRDFNSDEFVVLACDGVFRVMSNQDCIDFVRAELAEPKLRDVGSVDLDAVCERLVLRCITPVAQGGLGSGDNVSVVIVLLRENGNATPSSAMAKMTRLHSSDGSSGDCPTDAMPSFLDAVPSTPPMAGVGDAEAKATLGGAEVLADVEIRPHQLMSTPESDNGAASLFSQIVDTTDAGSEAEALFGGGSVASRAFGMQPDVTTALSAVSESTLEAEQSSMTPNPAPIPFGNGNEGEGLFV